MDTTPAEDAAVHLPRAGATTDVQTITPAADADAMTEITRASLDLSR